MGILAAIAIPRFTGVRDNAAKGAAEADARTVLSAVGIYYAENGSYPTADDEVSVLTSVENPSLNETVDFTDANGNFTYTTTDVIVTVTDGAISSEMAFQYFC